MATPVLVGGLVVVTAVSGMAVLLLRLVGWFAGPAVGARPGNLDVRTAGLRLGGDAAPARCSGSLVGERAPAGESLALSACFIGLLYWWAGVMGPAGGGLRRC